MTGRAKPRQDERSYGKKVSVDVPQFAGDDPLGLKQHVAEHQDRRGDIQRGAAAPEEQA
jgi:hypothetical protein